MAYIDVKEQGATRQLPDFYEKGRKHFDNRVPPGERKRVRPTRPKLPRPGDKDYVPRNPRSPKKWPGGLPPLPDGTPRRKPDIAPVPLDQNPYKARPFGGVKRARPNVGKMFGRAFKRANPFGRAFDIADFLDEWVLPPARALPYPVPNPGSGWVEYSRCPPLLGKHDTGGTKTWHLGCLSGQGRYPLPAPGIIEPPVQGDGIRDIRFGLWKWNGSVDTERFSHVISWGRERSDPWVEPALITTETMTLGPAMFPAPDPNVMRDAPSILPEREPGLDPEWVLGVGEGLGHPSAHDAAAEEMERVGVSVAVVPHYNVIDITPPPAETDDTTPPRPPRPKPHGRRKPYGRRREIPKTKGSVYAFFAALDALSEGAEVVDALFGALPEDVQKRWKRGRRTRPFIDTAGQYGIDGADWKMQAVWHNAHKVDPVEFWRNILANQTEDKLIGSLHRNLPRNFINANEDGQKAYAKLVRELLQALGLEDEEE